MTDFGLWQEMSALFHKYGYEIEDLHIGGKRRGLSTSSDRTEVHAVLKVRA